MELAQTVEIIKRARGMFDEALVAVVKEDGKLHLTVLVNEDNKNVSADTVEQELKFHECVGDVTVIPIPEFADTKRRVLEGEVATGLGKQMRKTLFLLASYANELPYSVKRAGEAYDLDIEAEKPHQFGGEL